LKFYLSSASQKHQKKWQKKRRPRYCFDIEEAGDVEEDVFAPIFNFSSASASLARKNKKLLMIANCLVAVCLVLRQAILDLKIFSEKKNGQ